MTLKIRPASSLIVSSEILAMLFGISLIVFNNYFLSSLILILAIFLTVIGIGRTATLFSVNKTNPVPAGLFVTPILTAISGVIIFLNPFETVSWVFIFFGSVLSVYSISDLITTMKGYSK